MATERALLVLALALGACGGTNRCKSNTMLVSISLDSAAAAADALDIDVSVDGSAKTTEVAHAAGSAQGTIEVQFPAGYPTGKSVTVTVTAMASGAPIGDGMTTLTLPAGCATVSLSVAGGDVTMGGDDMPASGGTYALGAQCGDPAQCASGFCVDGVCCDSDCTGACKYCAAPGSVGTCTNSLAGTNWRSACVADTTNPCGTNGMCDGSGQCQLRPAGTACSAQSCTGGTLTEASACDGAGKCQTPTTRACAPYVCKSDQTDCYSSCTAGGSECAASNVCTNGSCGPGPNGATCNPTLNGTDCMSGHCVDGVCCDTGCTGLCQACNITGKVGTCSNIPAGTTSTSDCPQDATSTCGRDGTCDGAGACHLYAAGTVCVASSCSSTSPYSFYPARTCNGSGSCNSSPPSQACGKYACDATYGCFTQCNSSITVSQCKATNSMCATGYSCTCTSPPPGTLGCPCACN